STTPSSSAACARPSPEGERSTTAEWLSGPRACDMAPSYRITMSSNQPPMLRPTAESSQPREHRLADFAGAGRAAEIRPLDTVGKRGGDRLLDPRGIGFAAEAVPQHHRQAENHRHRVGLALASDVRRAAVDRLVK